MVDKRSNESIVGLDLIRCVAALMVVFYHYGYWIWTGALTISYLGGHEESYHWLAPYTWFGWLGVEIFFVISGFVITYSAQRSTPRKFVRSRALRIYPTAWICATLTAFFLLADLGWHINKVLLSSWAHTMLLLPWTGNWVDGVYWTLAVEMSFYSIIFLLLVLKRFKDLEAVMLLLGAMSTVISFYEVGAWRHILPVSRLGTAAVAFCEKNVFYTSLIRYGLFFALGTLLWLYFFDRRSLFRSLAIAVYFLGACAEVTWHIDVETGNYIPSLHGGLSLAQWIPVLIWIASFAAIVLTIKYNIKLRRLLGDSGCRVARNLGLMTYPLYLLHQRIGFIMIPWFQHWMPDLVAMIIMIPLSIIAAFAVALFVEPRLRAAITRRFDSRKKERPLPAASLP